MATLELTSGRVIERVTRIVAADDGYLNVHTPGSGYFVVDPKEWKGIYAPYGRRLDITPDDIINA